MSKSLVCVGVQLNISVLGLGRRRPRCCLIERVSVSTCDVVRVVWARLFWTSVFYRSVCFGNTRRGHTEGPYAGGRFLAVLATAIAFVVDREQE